MKILLIAPGIAATPTMGTHQRTLLLHRALRRYGTVETVVLRSRDSFEESEQKAIEQEYGDVYWFPLAPYGEHGLWKLLRPLRPSGVDRMARALNRIALNYISADYAPDPEAAPKVSRLMAERQYDLIVGRYLNATTASGVLHAAHCPPVLLDMDDHDIAKLQSCLEDPDIPLWQKLTIRWRTQRLQRIVPGLLQRCSQIWVSNPNDKDDPVLKDAIWLPNIPFRALESSRDRTPLPTESSKSISMMVSGHYKPNVRGVTHFVEKIWPRIHQACPEATLNIYGARISTANRRQWSSATGVNVVGFVEDIANAYRDSALTVAPIYSGGGTNIKVIESLDFGRPCVITPQAWRGYEKTLPDGEAVLVAHNDDQFVDKCTKLLLDHALRSLVATNGRVAVRDHYKAERYLSVVSQTLDKIQPLTST